MWTFDRAKLKTLRELKGLSTKAMAGAIGRSDESYRLKERGDAPITVDELCKIGTAFKIDPRSFLIDIVA